jgi:hypothetical protein
MHEICGFHSTDVEASGLLEKQIPKFRGVQVEINP